MSLVAFNQHSGSLTVTPPEHTEELTTAQWARLLVLAGKSANESAGRRAVQREVTQFRMAPSNGGLTKVIAVDALPHTWQEALLALRERRQARTFAGILTAPSNVWQAPVAIESVDDETRDEALKRKEALRAYFAVVDSGGLTKEALMKARHKFEELTGEAVSDRTVGYWVARVKEAIGPCGVFDRAPLEAFCRWNRVEHEQMKKVNRYSKLIPQGVNPRSYRFKTFLQAFKAQLSEPGCEMVTAAHRHFDMMWRAGQPVPGLGVSLMPGLPLPFTEKQLRDLAPSKPVRVTAARGKARAIIDGFIPRLQFSGESPLLIEVQFDDTRANFIVKDDHYGTPKQIKLYLAIEVTTRLILAWTAKSGNFTAADTAMLMAAAARRAGLPHPDSGVECTYKIENGCVAAPNARIELLNSMYSGRLRIVRHQVVGGANLPGDYAQAGHGAFWQKGIVESVNKALGIYARCIPGQRGSEFRDQPAMLGTAGRKAGTAATMSIKTPGSQLAVAAPLPDVAHLMAVLNGETQLSAREEAMRYGIESPFLFETDAIEAIGKVIEWHNTAIRQHEMKGDWREVRLPKDGGGFRTYKESPQMKWDRMHAELAAQGIAPQPIREQDVALWLLRAEKVTATADGVFIDGRRYFSGASYEAGCIGEAARNHTGRKEFLALVNDHEPEFVWILENALGDHRQDKTVKDARLRECLPLFVLPGRADHVATAQASAQTRRAQTVVIQELAKVSAPRLAKQDQRRVDTVQKVLGTFAKLIAEGKQGEALSHLANDLHAARLRAGQPKAAPSEDGVVTEVTVEPDETDFTEEPQGRAAAAPSAIMDLAAQLAAYMAENGISA